MPAGRQTTGQAENAGSYGLVQTESYGTSASTGTTVIPAPPDEHFDASAGMDREYANLNSEPGQKDN